MTVPLSRLAYPDLDEGVSREVLAQLDEAVVFGRLADKLGRRTVYGYEVLVLAAGAIASACAPGIWWLIAFRGILGFGIGGDYPVSATIMSECASRHDRGRMVALVFSMQGIGLVVGPLVAIGLLKAGISADHAWRIMLALGAVPALAVFWLRRRVRETPRFLLAQVEAEETATKIAALGQPTGIRAVLAEPRLRRWLAGASLSWLLFDFVYYGNTISSPAINKLVSPHASLVGATGITLAIFAVAALPGYLLAALTIDKIGRRLMQATGFAVIAAAFCGLWLIPGATTTLVPFLLLFGATYFFAEFGPNTTTFVYPAEIFPVRVRTTSHGIAAASGKLGAFIGTYALTAAPGHRARPDQRHRGRSRGLRPARHGDAAARAEGHQPGRAHRDPPGAGAMTRNCYRPDVWSTTPRVTAPHVARSTRYWFKLGPAAGL